MNEFKKAGVKVDINTSDEDLIWDLTPAEMSVLFWVCRGLTNEAIATKRGRFEPTVKTQLSSIYKKLKIDEGLADDEKRNTLTDKYRDALHNVVPDEESLETYGARKRLREAEKRRQNSGEARGLRETIDGLRNRQGMFIPPPAPRVRLILLITLGLIGIIGIAVAVVLTIGGQQNNKSSSFTPTTSIALNQLTTSVRTLNLTNTATLQMTNTRISLAVEPSLSTQTTTPFPLTPTEMPPATPTPTNTAIPTYTITPPTSTPSIALPFSDNFDNGINKPWDIIIGSWITNNGRLTIQFEDYVFKWIQLKADWTNYTVKADVVMNAGKAAIVVRQSESNPKMLGYLMGFGNINCWTYFNSQDEPCITEQLRTLTKKFTIELRINGNNYTAFVNGVKTQSISLTGYDKGGIVLGVWCQQGFPCPSFDNLSIEQLK